MYTFTARQRTSSFQAAGRCFDAARTRLVHRCLAHPITQHSIRLDARYDIAYTKNCVHASAETKQKGRPPTTAVRAYANATKAQSNSRGAHLLQQRLVLLVVALGVGLEVAADFGLLLGRQQAARPRAPAELVQPAGRGRSRGAVSDCLRTRCCGRLTPCICLSKQRVAADDVYDGTHTS